MAAHAKETTKDLASILTVQCCVELNVGSGGKVETPLAATLLAFA
jgi:hypothetical protein